MVGCGASPSDICLSNDYLISLALFDNVIHLNRDECTVTAQGGIKLCKLNQILDTNGLALPV